MLHHHVLVVGDDYSGKTSLCLRLAHGLPPSSSYVTTLAIASYFAEIGPKHSVTLYDTPGHTRFHGSAESRYARCDVVVMMGYGPQTENAWFQRISAWAPFASWIVVSRSASDVWPVFARERHLSYCELDIQGDKGVCEFIRLLKHQCSFHATRPVPLRVGDTTDEQYLSYCT